MTVHLRLASGPWIGGAEWAAADVATGLADLTPLAALWGEALIVTRVDNRGGKRGQTWRVEVPPATAPAP